MRELVERLIAHEALADSLSPTNIPAGFRVAEKLRLPLTTLIGKVAFRALLSAALGAAKVSGPQFNGVKISPEGSLEGWSELGHQDEGTRAGVVLISQLLSLLGVLVGEALTLKVVFAVWPDFTYALRQGLTSEWN